MGPLDSAPLAAGLEPLAGAVEVGPWRTSTAGARCRSYESTTDGVAGLDISLRVHGV